MGSRAHRAARFTTSVVAGAIVAALVEAVAALLEPPWLTPLGHALRVSAAVVSATVFVHLFSVALLHAIVRGLGANAGFAQSARRLRAAVVGDIAVAPAALGSAVEASVFVLLSGLGFVGVALWSEDGIATPELRAPFIALADLGVVGIAWLGARAISPVARTFAERIEGRRRGSARLVLRAAAVLCSLGALLGVVLGWDYVVTLDRRLLTLLVAAGIGLLVARAVDRRTSGRLHSRRARVAALLSPLLVVGAGMQAGVGLARGSAAAADAAVRSASASWSLAFVRPSVTKHVRPSPRRRVQAAPHVALPDDVPTPKHLVILSIDALRADRLGCYGYRDHPTSPAIDRLARRGALFEEAHVQAVLSLRSFPSAFLGLYPHAIRWRRYMPGRMMPAPGWTRPLAVILREGGFRTLAILHTRYIKNEGILNGFDEVIVDGPTKNVRARTRTLRADRHVRRAIRSLRQTPVGDDERLLLWMHFIEPHGPYNPVPDFPWGDSDEDHYAAEIRYTDRALGRFVEYLEEAGIAKDALFVLFSDHGEEFGEHGKTSHGRSLYRAGTRVPFLFWGAGVRPGRYRTAVGLMDLLPTVLDLLRIDVPFVHGSSLAQTLTTGNEPPVRTIGSELYPTRIVPPTRWSAQRDGWKLITSRNLDPLELYNVEADPDERRNYVMARPGIREALRSDLAAIRALGRSRPRRRRR